MTGTEQKQKQPSCVRVSKSLYAVLMVEIRCFCGFFPHLFSALSFSFFFTLFWKFDLQPCRAWQFPFYSVGRYSASFPFYMISVERLISIVAQSFYKMFRLYFIVCFLLTVCQSCRLIVPAELLNGCIFDPMIVSVSHAGFSINRDNCNTAIAKHVFAEQPLVYYGRAKSVICFVKSDFGCCEFSRTISKKKHINVRNNKKNSIFLAKMK